MQGFLRYGMRRLGHWLGATLCLAAGIFSPATGHAGSMLPCTDARVFQGALVNSFVLPYRLVAGRPTPELERASRQIAGLVHLEVLFSMLKYGRVGGTDLLAIPGKVCDVDQVIARVTTGRGPGTLLPGHALVVVWGRLFEEGDQYYVQSYVRFLRQGAARPMRETIRVVLDGADARLELDAELPTQSIAFPPRRIAKSDLAALDREFRKSMVVRKQKRLDEPGRSIDFSFDHPFPYGVTKAEGDWMWIEPMMGGPAGWVRARFGDEPEEWSLRRWLPELAFVDAINGFMRLRALDGAEAGPKLAPRLQGWIEDGFARFERALSSDDAPAAYGLANAVRGFALWHSQSDAKARAEAAQRFRQTRTFMPEYAAARNLAAVTQPLLGDGAFDAKAVARLGRDLVGALALDPGDATTLSNLERVYRVFEARPALSPHPAEDLKNRLALVRNAQAKAPPLR